MKKILLMVLSIGILNTSFSQKEIPAHTTSAKEKKAFFKFLVPNAINGGDIAPAGRVALNLDMGDDKAEFKFGRPFSKAKNNSDSTGLNSAWFVATNIAATDGITTLYQYDNAPIEYGFKAGLTFITGIKHWVDNNGETSSERVHWVNIIPKVNMANLNLFSGDTTYSEVNATTASLMVNWNAYFHSTQQFAKVFNGIVSFGIGLGRINNYKQLDQITLEKGKLINTSNYTYLSKLEDDVEGRLGTLAERTVPLYNIEVYKSLKRHDKYAWYLGAGLNGYSGKDASANGNLGMYFSFIGTDDAGDKAEKFGLAIVGSFKNLQGIEDKESFRKRFAIVLRATVPLNFSLTTEDKKQELKQTLL